MKNSFNDLQSAVDSWGYDSAWMKWYWTKFSTDEKPACVCFDDGKYFIITHPLCVKYREKIGQVIMYLHISEEDAVKTGKYLSAEDVYSRALDELDLSNPEVDQEMRMGELMGLTYVEDLNMWFNEAL